MDAFGDAGLRESFWDLHRKLGQSYQALYAEFTNLKPFRTSGKGAHWHVARSARHVPGPSSPDRRLKCGTNLTRASRAVAGKPSERSTLDATSTCTCRDHGRSDEFCRQLLSWILHSCLPGSSRSCTSHDISSVGHHAERRTMSPDVLPQRRLSGSGVARMNARIFMDMVTPDRYADDRKAAVEKEPKMEKVVSRKLGIQSLFKALFTFEQIRAQEKCQYQLGGGCVREHAERKHGRRLGSFAQAKTMLHLGSKILEDLLSTTQKSRAGCDDKFVMTPGGRSRAIWDALRMLCVIIDIVVIPLRFFDSPIGDAKQSLSVFALIFWTCDIIASFRTGQSAEVGSNLSIVLFRQEWRHAIPSLSNLEVPAGYFENGTLVMESQKVACHYLKRAFIFDFAVVLLDYILLGLDGFGPVDQLPEPIRIVQFIRMIRVGRLYKWNQMFFSLRERIESNNWVARISILNIICQILLLYHVVACIFFGIGKFYKGEISWIEHYGLAEQSFAYQYSTTLHWALCQLGMGSNIIEATNLPERLFGILAVLTSEPVRSLVSLMTSLLTSLHNEREEELHQFRLLRSFLVRNQIDRALSQRVTRFLQHSWTVQREALSETQVPLLNLLHKRSLNLLAFVDQLFEGDNLQQKDVAHDIAASAITQNALASGEVVFYYQNLAEHVFMAHSGSLAYWQNGGKTVAKADIWIAEMCLWTPWSFVGDLITQEVTVFDSWPERISVFEKVDREELEDDHGRNKFNIFGAKDRKRRASVLKGQKSDKCDELERANNLLPAANGLPGIVDFEGFEATTGARHGVNGLAHSFEQGPSALVLKVALPVQSMEEVQLEVGDTEVRLSLGTAEWQCFPLPKAVANASSPMAKFSRKRQELMISWQLKALAKEVVNGYHSEVKETPKDADEAKQAVAVNGLDHPEVGNVLQD
eukprot:g21738.t1